jgi:DNA-binding CsgD family transcriptional regulator/tetratricopeptide (TPR) repeat protein
MVPIDRRHSSSRRASPGTELERGRECYGQRAWGKAFELLSLADRKAPLDGDDLELLAMASYLVGRDDDYLKALERAHHAHLEAADETRSTRCAFWIGLRLLFRGEVAHAGGWFARARRLLERAADEQVEHGYLLVAMVEQQLACGDCEGAYASASSAAEIGERFGDSDLVAIARHQQGHARIAQGQVEQGLTLFDEAMVAVTTSACSPLVTGLVYCGVIGGCQLVHALGRAREWTSALAAWCAEQPEMVAFTGLCQVHRAEILQLHGAWPEAIDAAQRAGARCRGVNQRAAGAASYQEAEVHRLRGEFAAAEEAYRAASESGYEPQPGLALLRVAQRRTEAAVAAVRRVAGATTDRWQRARLLPAYVEVMLAAGEVADARNACHELAEIAGVSGAGVLGAMAAQARGAVELAGGDARDALGSLRHAWCEWQQVDAPYPAARARELVGLCCRALGDEDGATLELDAARQAFEQLGAAPDRARVDGLLRGAAPKRPHGLTPRELQVLRLLAAGKTNKVIAAELFLSEKTVERHVSNLFGKLDVGSRAGATAFAYEHGLI